MKIFITGFQRSGTTLLETLFSKHPDVKIMFHEQCILTRFGSLKNLYRSKFLPSIVLFNKKKRGKLRSSKPIKNDLNLKSSIWGEKVPFYHIPLNKHNYKGTILSYCDLWNSHFLPDAKIIYIVRHPVDVGLSTKKIRYSKNIGRPIQQYKIVVPRVIKYLKEYPNVIFVSYENLVCEPVKTLKRLFKRCGLDHSDKIIQNIIDSDIYWFGSINESRAFNYKNSDVNIKKYELSKTIGWLNKNIKGLDYE